MKTWLAALLLLICGTLFLPATVRACPNCREAVAESGLDDEDDPMRESRAYNQSIYFMVFTPYLLLGGCGLLMYYWYRKRPTPLPSAEAPCEAVAQPAEPAQCS